MDTKICCTKYLFKTSEHMIGGWLFVLRSGYDCLNVPKTYQIYAILFELYDVYYIIY